MHKAQQKSLLLRDRVFFQDLLEDGKDSAYAADIQPENLEYPAEVHFTRFGRTYTNIISSSQLMHILLKIH